MPDDETPPEAPDERDEHVAALLAVEPLDDVARRRLVSTALRSTGTARQARRLMAAAAVVVVLVAGAGVVIAVGGGGNSTSSTAARDKAARALPASGTENGVVAGSVRSVGDFGDLGSAANVERLRRAFDAVEGLSVTPAVPTGAASAAGQAPASRSGTEPANDAASSDALVNRFRALGCSLSALPPGTVVALASGTLDRHPVIVVDLESAGGAHSFHAIETDTCKVHRLS
jgi:hypothetical protein